MTDNAYTTSPLHQVLRLVVAFAFGIALAFYAYQWIADPEPRQQRMQEEAVVLKAREILKGYIAVESTAEIVDPLNKNRVAGKVYIYPIEDGWEVSGHYRRAGEVLWQPWLMTLDQGAELVLLSVQDPLLAARARTEPRLVVKAKEQ